jgi:hypothetical protein
MAKKAKKAAKKSKVTRTAKALKTAKKATTKKAATKKPAKKSAVKKSATFGTRQWTPEVVKELKVLIKQNTPTPLIASKLDRSVASIRNKVNELGLSLKPTNRSPAD